MRLCHFIGDHIAVNIHGGSDVGMAHELLLYSDWCSHGIKPRPICMPHGMCTKSAEPCILRSPRKIAHHLVVTPRLPSQLARRCKNPIAVCAEQSCPFPDAKNV